MKIFKSKKEREKEIKEENAKQAALSALKVIGPILIAILLFVVIRFGIMNKDYTLENVSVSKYTSLVSGNKPVLVYFSTDNCDMCDEIEAMFKKVLKGSNIKIYQVETDKLSNTEIESLMGVLDITKEGIETPLLILVKDKEVISNFRVPVDEDLFIEYLQKNNLVK